MRAIAPNGDGAVRWDPASDLQLLVDSPPSPIHMGRPDGYLDFFNQAWLRYPDLLGDVVSSVFAPVLAKANGISVTLRSRVTLGRASLELVRTSGRALSLQESFPAAGRPVWTTYNGRRAR